MLRPNGIAARRYDAVGVNRVLERLMEFAQSVIVERIGVRNSLIKGRGCSIFAPSMFSGGLHDCFECLSGSS